MRSSFALFQFAAALVTAPLLVAQATLIVDARGGTGVFTEIQLAVDAATNGDTILVRRGDYSGFRIRAKAITLSADAGARVNRGASQSLIVSAAPAGSRTVIQGLRFESVVRSQIAVIGSPGTIVFDGVEMANEMVLCDFTHAELVHIERCKFQGTVMFQSGTTAVVVDSEFRGITSNVTTSARQQPVILANGAAGRTLYIAQSTIVGANSATASDLPGSAIAGNGQMRVVLRRDSTMNISAGTGVLPRSAIEGPISNTAELVVDTRVRVTGNANAQGIAWNGPVQRRTDPVLTSTPALVGTILQLEVRAAPKDNHVLFFGVPSPPMETPIGELSISLPLYVAVGVGSTFKHRIAIPNVAALRGIVLGWQVLVQNSAKLLRLGNVSLSFLR